MSVEINGSFETKQIHELYPLQKLNGKEEVLIDNGEVTLRVTVDTLLGYIRDQIHMSLGGDPSTGGGADTTGPSGPCIHVMEEGGVLPIESRLPGHYYLRICDVVDAKLAAGLYRLIRVSPNMGLRLVED